MERHILRIDMAAYHAAPGISSGALRCFARSPAHYRARYLLALRELPSRALELGSALHRLIESPKGFEAEYCVRPNGLDGRSKAFKEWTAEQNGKRILTADELADLTCMAASVRRHSRVMRILSRGLTEPSVFWTDEETGLACKARPDHWNQRLSLILDFKTCTDARPDAVQRSIASYGYHIQAAWYLEGTGAAQWAWVFIEKSPPYGCAIYLAGSDLLVRAREEIRHLLADFATCLQRDQWPSYSESITEVNLPAWASRS
jgi:exodeoxyribonuclease VIII